VILFFRELFVSSRKTLCAWRLNAIQCFFIDKNTPTFRGFAEVEEEKKTGLIIAEIVCKKIVIYIMYTK